MPTFFRVLIVAFLSLAAGLACAADPLQIVPDTALATFLREQGIFKAFGQQIAMRDVMLTQMTKGLPPDRLVVLDAELDRLFDKNRVEREIYEHVDHALWPEYRDFWSEWARRKGVTHSDSLLLVAMDQPLVASGALAPERKMLLKRLAIAIHLRNRFVSEVETLRRFQGECMDAMSAASSAVFSENLLPASLIVPSDEELIDEFAGPALRGLSDEDLLTDLAFAESKAGNQYFGALATITFDFDSANISAIKNLLRSASIGNAAQEPALNDAAKRARQIYVSVTKRAASPKPELQFSADYAALVEANQLSPNDPQILTELGLFATTVSQRPSPPDVIHKLYDSDGLSRAQEFLNQAVAINPSEGDAHVYLGYIDFLYDHLDEADAHYRRAQVLGATTPWLASKRADLDYSRGSYQSAVDAYRRILTNPPTPYGVAVTAFSHLKLAAGKLHAPDLFAGPARAYVVAAPWATDQRNELAAFDIDVRSNAGDAIALLDGESQLNDYGKELLATALAFKASQMRPSKTLGGATSDVLLARALALAGSRDQLARYAQKHPAAVGIVEFIARGANARDVDSSILLEQALFADDLQKMRSLLQSGADPDTHASRYPPPTTLLYVAMLFDRRESFALLLEFGASPSLPQTGGLSIDDMCEQPKDYGHAWACSLISAHQRRQK